METPQTQYSSFFTDTTPNLFIQKPKDLVPPTITKTQQRASNFINDSQDTSSASSFSLSNVIKSSKQNSDVNVNRNSMASSINKSYEIAMRSVRDLTERMSDISKLGISNNIPKREQQTGNNITNNQVTNNSSNTTVITTDYVRNLRVDYQTMPVWRAHSG